MSYVIGGLIVAAILIFTIKQIKSVVESIRKARSSKSSEEGKDVAREQPSEGSEKEVDSK